MRSEELEEYWKHPPESKSTRNVCNAPVESVDSGWPVVPTCSIDVWTVKTVGEECVCCCCGSSCRLTSVVVVASPAARVGPVRYPSVGFDTHWAHENNIEIAMIAISDDGM